jgi:glycerol-3-phosphate acyltransferase PlsY
LVVAVLVGAYLLGGVPWSLIIGRRFFGVDLREHGSGNLGATNVFRVLGARAAVSTALLDVGKGSAAVGLARVLVRSSVVGTTAADWVAVGAMIAAVVGHSYSPYIRFRGGKGVATSGGGLLVLTPMVVLIELLVFVAVIATLRIVSLGSVVIALFYPVLVVWRYPGNTPLLVTSLFISVLVVWRHRSNIARIVRGEESKISIGRRGSALDQRPSENASDEGEPR